MPTRPPQEPEYFATPADFRDWLDANHQTASELLVGFRKKGSGLPSMTWPESVDEALCVGWIDGIRRSLDRDSYTIRFTPRKPRSIWSAINIAKVEALIEQGRMRPAGLRAYEARSEARSQVYSYEQREEASFPGELAAELHGDAAAWAYFQTQPPSYRRTATWYVVSAKREETRRRRMASLIAHCAAGKRLPQFIPPRGKS